MEQEDQATRDGSASKDGETRPGDIVASIVAGKGHQTVEQEGDDEEEDSDEKEEDEVSTEDDEDEEYDDDDVEKVVTRKKTRRGVARGRGWQG